MRPQPDSPASPSRRPGGCEWLGIILIGVGHGGLFPLVLAVPVSASRDADHARRLSGMAFFIGYACAAAAPLLVGWLGDANGNFHLAFALLAATALAVAWPIARLSPRRLAACAPAIQCHESIAEPYRAFTGIGGISLYHWPPSRRAEPAAKMHAKLAVADRRVLVITSANLTASGVTSNIEEGVLIRGGSTGTPPSM